MTNYVEMDPLALNRLAAERAGWRDVHVKSYTHAREMWGLPPGVEPDYKNYEIIPDYTGSVDAALQLPGLADVHYVLEYMPTARCDKFMAEIDEGIPGQEWLALDDEPAFAIVCAWLAWQAARAGKGAS